MSASNERGGAPSSVIVLDELSGILGEYWCLDPAGPQSAECGKWEVSLDLKRHKMSEKCSSWKTVFFGWGGSREWRGGEGEWELIIFYTSSPTYFTVNIFVYCQIHILKILMKLHI